MKISVLIITYNHEKYIAQALESVLAQKTDFDFEIVVGDDGSTDKTREILRDYQGRYPQKIRLLLPEKNSGATRNFINTYNACRGQFVAILEGDDYWTTSGKLQLQVDFLESHPEFALCFTNSRIVNEYGEVIKESRLDEDRRKNLTQADIISGLVPPTNTVVFRNGLITEIPEVFYEGVNGDILFFSMLAKHGVAGYIDEVTGDYRMHGGGSWAKKPEVYLLLNNLKVRLALLQCFPEFKDILLPSINYFYSELLVHYLKIKSPIDVFSVFARFVLTDLKFLNFGFLKYLVIVFRKSFEGDLPG